MVFLVKIYTFQSFSIDKSISSPLTTININEFKQTSNNILITALLKKYSTLLIHVSYSFNEYYQEDLLEDNNLLFSLATNKFK